MRILQLTTMLLVAVSFAACKPQSSQDQKPVAVDTGEIQIYYFHFTKRCATCNAVETETKLALEMFYADQMQEGSIAFISLNLEEEDGKEKATQLEVSGQTLLLVKGDVLVNLTNEGFMNARTKPDSFHEVLRTQINQLL